jgi:hypothetical protein
MKAIKNKPARKRLTGKQKAFADAILANPTTTGKAAAQVAYGVTGNTAEVMAYENLRNPHIMQYLENHATNAELAVIEALNATQPIYMKGIRIDEIPDNQIRLAAAKDILDRIHGKPTQKIETRNTSVAITVDLTHTT